MASASLEAARRSSRTLRLAGRIAYSTANPRLVSTPPMTWVASFARLGFLGRSRTWPMEATTRKSRPRYLLMVFALAGDSTMTRFLATSPSVPAHEECARQSLHPLLQFERAEAL